MFKSTFDPTPTRERILRGETNRTAATKGTKTKIMAPHDGSAGETERRENFPLIHITFEWLNTLLGKIIIAELILTFLCGCLSSSITFYVGYGCAGKTGFLDFVAWTAFINLLIDIIIRILGLWERLFWIFRHPAIHGVLCCLAVVGFLIGSSLVASCANSNRVYNPGTAIVAAIFGFICLFFFTFEAFLHYQRYRNMESEGRRQTSSEDAKADVI